jgi:ABC-2 type transport system permease protein
MTRSVLRKDLVALWTSPIPYVVGALFNLVLTTLYVSELESRQQALIQPLFPLAGFLLLALIPLVTMRSFSEEAKTGTLDLLLAVPVPPRPLVVGKWLAAWLTVAAAASPSALFAALLYQWGSPDGGPVISGFLGLVLLVGAVSGMGVLASTLTSSQPVAAMITLFVGLLLWFAHVGSESLTTGAVLLHFSISERLRSFAGGVIDMSDVAFLAVLPAGALVLAAAVLDSRRFR